MAKYRALTGLSYGIHSVEAGTIVDNIPAKSIRWLREQGLIEQVDGKEDVLDDASDADLTEDDK